MEILYRNFFDLVLPCSRWWENAWAASPATSLWDTRVGRPSWCCFKSYWMWEKRKVWRIFIHIMHMCEWTHIPVHTHTPRQSFIYILIFIFEPQIGVGFIQWDDWWLSCIIGFCKCNNSLCVWRSPKIYEVI